VQNAQAAEGGKLQVQFEGVNGPIVDEALAGGNKWVRIGVSPGHYRVALRGTVGGHPVTTACAIIIKAGEVTKAELPLPT
jgi:hypothetical protein